MILNLDSLFHVILDIFSRFENFVFPHKRPQSVFCRIHRNLKVLIFAYKLVDLIGLVILILNLDLLDEFRCIFIHFSRFRNFLKVISPNGALIVLYSLPHTYTLDSQLLPPDLSFFVFGQLDLSPLSDMVWASIGSFGCFRRIFIVS